MCVAFQPLCDTQILIDKATFWNYDSITNIALASTKFITVALSGNLVSQIIQICSQEKYTSINIGRFQRLLSHFLQI